MRDIEILWIVSYKELNKAKDYSPRYVMKAFEDKESVLSFLGGFRPEKNELIRIMRVSCWGNVDLYNVTWRNGLVLEMIPRCNLNE